MIELDPGGPSVFETPLRSTERRGQAGERRPQGVVDEVREPGRLADFREPWCRLADAQPDCELYGTWEWAGSLLEAFSHRYPPAAFFVFREGSLIGVFPFVRRTRRGLCRPDLAFPGEQSALLCAPGAPALEVLHGHLSRVCPRWHLSMPVCRRDSPTAEALRSWPDPTRRGHVERPVPPTQVIDLTGGWDAYLASRESHVRHEWRRKGRKLAGAGRIELVTYRTPAECDRALEAFFSIETRSWKDAIGRSLAEAGFREFHTLLARRTAQRGWLRLHVLYLESRPIAHLYGVVFRGQLHTLSTSFDPEQSGLSPGLAVVLHAVQEAAREGITKVDLLGSAQRWKREVGTGLAERVSLCLFPRGSWQCRTCHFIGDTAKPAIKRRFPALISLKKRGGEVRMKARLKRARFRRAVVEKRPARPGEEDGR